MAFKVNAVVLAGDRRASIAVRNENKAFLLLKDMPLLVHVLRALKRSQRVQDIILVGPTERLTVLLDDYADLLRGAGSIKVLAQRDNMIENFKVGYAHSVGAVAGSSFADLRRLGHQETPVMVVPCDVPLLTPLEVDEFVQRSNMFEYDYAIGITSEKVLAHYHPTEGKAGIRMIYFHVREDLLRHNNLHLCKPLKLAHLDYVERMYEWRYQTRLANILRMVGSMLFAGWRLMKGIRMIILMQLSLYYDRHGHPNLSGRLRSLVPFNRLAEGIGNALGARVQLVYTHFGGGALDVDHEAGLVAIEALYDEWMSYQDGLQEEDE